MPARWIHAAAISAWLAGAGCSLTATPPAIGSRSEVTLLYADGAQRAAETLRAALEEPLVLVTEPEPAFRVEMARDAASTGGRYARNLVVVAPLDAPGAAGRTARHLLGSEGGASVRRRGAGCRAFTDALAIGQNAFVLAATSGAALDSLSLAIAPEMRTRLESAVAERFRADALRDEVARSRAAELHRTHGFELWVPADYATAPPCNRWTDAVELARDDPLRVLTVFWLDGVDSAQARDAAFLVGLQRDLLWRLHGDTLLDDRAHLGPAWLGPYASQRLDAVWQNRQEVGGGILRTDFVLETGRRRLYGVQLLLFAPGRAKRAWMRELEALAGTFRCGGDGS